jgi:hypothetical protein
MNTSIESTDFNLLVLWNGAELIMHEAEPGGEIGLLKGDVSIDGKLLDSRNLDQIESDDTLLRLRQAHLSYGTDLEVNEGRLESVLPIDAWHNPKLDKASRIVLREIILKPNGLIDN